jgi:hypothetical protein
MSMNCIRAQYCSKGTGTTIFLCQAKNNSTTEALTVAAIYLASRAGDYVVGVTLAVDGGIAYANPGIAAAG